MALALWPATAGADQHVRTAEPLGPLPLALACPEGDIDVLAFDQPEANPAPVTPLDRVEPDTNDRVSYSLHSAAADCTTLVVFHDANTNDQLDVNAQGQPLEHWNVTERAWESADAATRSSSLPGSPAEPLASAAGTAR